MKIKFLQDYVGRETAMKEHKKGDIIEIQFPTAAELIRLGVACGVVEETQKPEKKKVKDADAQ